jgi:hypothetical protein
MCVDEKRQPRSALQEWMGERMAREGATNMSLYTRTPCANDYNYDEL